jgi:very-short-patch-repair endonuclease
MELQRARLLGLIDYVEATERDKLKTVLEYNGYKGLCHLGTALDGLPGVSLDQRSAEDNVWLHVQRLLKNQPPVIADDELPCWVSLSDDPDRPPKLHSEAKLDTLREQGVSDLENMSPEFVKLEGYSREAAIRAAFDLYVTGVWSGWAENERPRRKTIKFYNELFALRHLLEGSGESPTELVCGIGFATMLKEGQRLCHPLITVPLEISLDTFSHALEVRPRSEAPTIVEADIVDKLELEHVDEWRSFAYKVLDDDESEPISPFERASFESILRRAAAVLDSNGVYVSDNAPHLSSGIPTISDHLQVSDAFCLIQRDRRVTQLMDDLTAFKRLVGDEERTPSFPGAIETVLKDPAKDMGSDEYPTFRGISTVPGITTADGLGQDLFFPKPFNREQVEVVQRLTHRAGVVVQGPPGTGKTHTISNIICHYLASGKRVLVTSQKVPALRVLRSQLPAAIQPLAVSLLDSDRDGLKQFQESVDVIAEKLQRLRRHDLLQDIEGLEAEIDGLHRKLALIDREVDDIGRAAITPVDLDGARCEPVAAAHRIMDDPDRAQWFHDPLDVGDEFDPRFSDIQILALRAARKVLGYDLAYLGVRVPNPADLPSDSVVFSAHDDLSRAEALRQSIGSEETPPLADASDAGIAKVQDLCAELRQLQAARSEADRAARGWTSVVREKLGSGSLDPSVDALKQMRHEIEALDAECAALLIQPVDLPKGWMEDQPLLEAIDRLAAGENATGFLGGLFNSKLKTSLAAIRLVGRAPRHAAEWQNVRRHIEASARSQRLQLSWNFASPHSGLEPLTASHPRVAHQAKMQLDHLETLENIRLLEIRLDREVVSLIPACSTSIIADEQATSDLLQALEKHVTIHRLRAAEETRALLNAVLQPCEGEISDVCRGFVNSFLGNPNISAGSFRENWLLLRRGLDKLQGQALHLVTVNEVTKLIAESGAAVWADRLRTMPVENGEDVLSPGDWAERWTLKRLSTWLSRTDRHGRLLGLAKERRQTEDLLKRAYERCIEQRTWLELSGKASDSVKAALAAYADAIRKIGRGTGKRAGRYRKDARAASERAKSALPCWIMPHYRVSESLPPELGLFDLVIVDEASQSTLAALPALLRAKQMLIVGDDRQVSPDHVGRDQARADELATRHLSDQVPDYRSSLREDQSLYDLGKVVFAGGTTMLTEHFRCVAPIIEFSKGQFYSHQLQPLRLPSASERLDPPLIDIHVEDGYRRGKINPPEADCIISEIQRIIDDPAMESRSIGVTTLLGQEQAALIYSRIENDLGVELIEKHHIRVGDPSAFQGDERDIMFVSLVAEKNDSPLSGRGYEQRFNVAMSRARDRVILVRSVQLDELRQSDGLRRALLEHFRVPFPADGASAKSRRERCESPFEEEMFDLLAMRGYRVDTQVRVGNFRIDLVVEGEDDRRLAVECDGDRYHGPDRWADDMARQRILERAGWQVWRCFASRFVRQRNQVIDELVETLNGLNIRPMPASGDFQSRYTEHRTWRSEPASVGVAASDDRASPPPHVRLVAGGSSLLQ